MPWSDYQLIKEIGSGSFGRAVLVHNKDRQLVMKEIDLSGRDEKQRANADLEVKVLSSLKHPYIVRYWESFMHGRHLCIIMDYCEGGDLWHYLAQCRRQRAPVHEAQVLRWFTQMVLALKYIHEKNVLHRDIKTQNVFLAKRDGGGMGCVKIADFGIAKVLGEGSHAFARTLVGTPYYLSPEICNKQPYACPSDVWAVGCVLYELCTFHVPFEAADLTQLVDKIVRGPSPRIPTTYSRDLGDIAHELLSRDASRRPTAAVLLQRPYLQAEIKRMLSENQRENGPADEGRGRGERRRNSKHGEGQREGSKAASGAHSDRGHRENRDNRDHRRPLGEHNSGTPRRANSKPSSRAPSPHRGAALEVLRPSRAPSPAKPSPRRS